MKLSKYIVLGAIALSSPAFVACVGDLDVTPENPTTKTEISTAEELYGELAGIYGGLVFEGGITVDDGGAGVYTRQLWNLQELCSDETLIGSNWADGGIIELVYSTWSPDNHWLYECFSRFNYQIAIVNQFLRDLHKYGSLLPGSDNLSVEVFDAEARTLRALSYYHMIDIFGVGPWTTEDSPVGVTPPTYDRKQLFEAVVEDLANAIPNLVPASQQVYGRLSREAGYMLLAKLYLNAEVYTGEPRWQDCANACNEIRKTIDTLAPTYKYLFCATNDKYVGNGEIIWGIPQDGTTLTTYGGTTYISGGSYRGDSDLLKTLGLAVSGWEGPRVREELSKALLPNDARRLIYEGEYTEDIQDLSDKNQGYMCVKFVYTPEDDYKNEKQETPYCNTIFNPADFPLFRLADVYLMLAECELNGAQGCNGLEMMNRVRQRAGLADVRTLTAENILDERMCELYWEGHRRSDLVRFGKFAGSNYNWSWKGANANGANVQAYRNVYCVPTQFVSTLGQNPGY
ncbi:RagB/SusD family nutrient uptake outer membrane protein [uncultured Duncaniella sp.]|uniref:RagB/SusD family nutrient uptake outer membrane protein n=1 Tax=uncultured Duncaniella sp. TaxID=2768039 RepID=UPI00272B67B7|nr:RagB/SusD family nutrient uptake outer membrane protein [uncultured Duncaniella sp.]